MKQIRRDLYLNRLIERRERNESSFRKAISLEAEHASGLLLCSKIQKKKLQPLFYIKINDKIFL